MQPYLSKEIIMNQKLALTLAAAITVFTLILGGGIAGRLAHPIPAASAATVSDAQSLYAQREDAYKAQIEAANQALAEAYAKQNDVSVELAAQPTADPAVVLTPQGAMSAAVIAVPGAQILSMPELVDYHGIVAYEVRLNLGVLYIDASNGAVLYSSIAPSQSVILSGNNDDDYENDND
jgi:uncharacterized membrane protein YkoI